MKENQVNKPLIIYKASAGSGKTFTLATEYIKLVVRNPLAYRKILAVTFTNKATEEMKMRILSQLYGIWKQLPSSKAYLDVVCKGLDASPEYVSKQAGIALSYLLHNYSYFRIDTIDSFFQSVLRNLARELELTANLRIGLNDGQVEEMAVDEMIENLSHNDLILKWILNYIMESINDDRSWNIINQVKSFGRTIFKDDYKAESKRLNKVVSQPKFFENYTATLNKTRAKAKARMKDIGDAFFKLLSDNHLSITDVSYGKTGVAGMFLKLQAGIFDESIEGARVKDCLDAPEKWYKKGHPHHEVLHALACGPLNQLLHDALKERPTQWKLYKSAELTLKHLNQLRLLESIEQKVRELNEESNRFLLSDTQQMLHDLIDGSDSPFIFEKIGTQLEHIMIDEFQDTSTVQWKNFKVLLKEAMSHEGTENLIVGDVKQSIYRWRSGDWRLLGNIENEFERPAEQLDVVPLKLNYRSSKYLIDFNNAFFIKAAELEEIDAYKDVEQLVPEGKEKDGYVNITLLPQEDYQDTMLEALKCQVEELLRTGVQATEMAILVRVNKQIPLIANYFMEHLPSVAVVSDEAFRLDASPAIQMIIQALRLLNHPDDLISKAFLAKAYSQQPLYQGTLDEKLPRPLVEGREELLRLPLYDLTETLCTIFRLNEMEGQTSYLCAFFDQVASFVNEQMTDIASFLSEWDETICSKTIQCPDINGIRLISIHKSKGLEFPYVLIPFCDWKLEMSTTLWCQPDEAPFNELPIVPVDYSKSGMTGTIYEKDYNEEFEQNKVDNMNLLYVAFTRAKKELYVWGKRGKKGSRSAIIEQVFGDKDFKLEGCVIEGLEDNKKPLKVEFGEKRGEWREESGEREDFFGEREFRRYDGTGVRGYDGTRVRGYEGTGVRGYEVTSAHLPILPIQPIIQRREESGERRDSYERKEENVFLQQSKAIPLRIEAFTQKVAFKQSNLSRDFAAQEDEQQQTNYIQLGSVLHNVFSTIRTKEDINAALQRMELDGILYDETITRTKIEGLIRKRLEDPRVADWYDKRWKLFNECTILNIDPSTKHVCERRPDRVMTDGKQMIVVDFKFGHVNNDYNDQVREYMQLLSSMGYQNIKGYLWYVYSNKIVEVYG